ncbi:MAG: multicopper oxidase domain-containing protein [Nitrospiraceae bacterium]|nr:MAG: multicopper oxidase domain-containing protein [Nitrospiraceae bacterium]
MKSIFVIALMTLAASCVSPGLQVKDPGDKVHVHKNGAFTQHLADSTLLVTKKGLFSVEMEIPDKRLLVGVNTVNLIIHDRRDRDVTGAAVEVTPWMPEMGHGVFSPLTVREKGNGLYTVENIVLVMGGHWEFRIHVKWGDEEDGVVFDFPYVRTSEGYDYIRAKTPAGFDVVLGTKNTLEELEPEVVKEHEKTIKVFTLTVRDIGFELFPDAPMMGWGFNGTIPGPTVRVTEGDRVRIILNNESSGKHTIHIHGQKKPVIMDGVPYIGQKPVRNGESYIYEFTVERVGTFFYHCHVDGAHHMDMGMYGAFIVEPAEERFSYDREYIMILDEWPTKHVHVHEKDDEEAGHEKHGVLSVHKGSPPEHTHPGDRQEKRDYYPKTHNPHDPVYDAFTINGKAFPLTEPIYVRKGEKIRIRFINAGYQPHYMHTHSHKFRVIARDGAYVNEPQMIDTVHIGSAQRVDVILEADNPGIWPFHCHRLNHVANDHIYPGGMMTFIVYEDYKAEEDVKAEEY